MQVLFKIENGEKLITIELLNSECTHTISDLKKIIFKLDESNINKVQFLSKDSEIDDDMILTDYFKLDGINVIYIYFDFKESEKEIYIKKLLNSTDNIKLDVTTSLFSDNISIDDDYDLYDDGPGIHNIDGINFCKDSDDDEDEDDGLYGNSTLPNIDNKKELGSGILLNPELSLETENNSTIEDNKDDILQSIENKDNKSDIDTVEDEGSENSSNSSSDNDMKDFDNIFSDMNSRMNIHNILVNNDNNTDSDNNSEMDSKEEEPIIASTNDIEKINNERNMKIVELLGDDDFTHLLKIYYERPELLNELCKFTSVYNIVEKGLDIEPNEEYVELIQNLELHIQEKDIRNILVKSNNDLTTALGYISKLYCQCE